MSLEITLRVNGLERSTNGSQDALEKLVKFVQDLEGVLVVRYDTESSRFAVSYNPNQATVLRILNRIELAGQQAGLGFRPTDVRTSARESFASRTHTRRMPPAPLPAADEPYLAVPEQT